MTRRFLARQNLTSDVDKKLNSKRKSANQAISEKVKSGMFDARLT